MVPVGSATIKQTVRIPDANQMREPRLQFWYRIKSYDVKYSERLKRKVDTLDVTLLDEQGNELALLLSDGNPTDKWGQAQPYDSGWRFADIDLRPYAGRTVTLSIANWNRNDNFLNTWSFVDQVQVRDPLRSFLPLLGRGNAVGAASVEHAPVSGATSAEPATAPDGSESIR
jgi:hypothetical protein